ncbi:DNA-binding response regulator, OmpR family, contains REC and winged-helix (wHTH) domain [Actinoplanes derwentensis]|uniref:DNA-binding response regulator, OmpR family, contains REC and winged-helix (WHTH) domain n=2 Tax=Actinoplanes derwentensis TaxID=113562 RepID=A0A1H2B6W1_9ACTN|nr:DNA-binding response regulator, OmpR family, contains REC and winged-helix (wHTH) domain [Actinoplanes derwentensis]
MSVRACESDTMTDAAPPPVKVLVVEDDRELGPLLLRLFRGAGYQPDLAPDGQAGLHLALTRAYDAMILDRGLPAIEGLDLLSRLRRAGVAVPVLVLTALGTVSDRVAGLDSGAEDYLVKPFEVDELLARVRVLLRGRTGVGERLAVGAATFDLIARTVTGPDGVVTALSGRESDLLRLLARNPARAFTREQIVTQVFPDASGVALVDTYVHYLRRKLGAAAVVTVRGVGYRLGPG